MFIGGEISSTVKLYVGDLMNSQTAKVKVSFYNAASFKSPQEKPRVRRKLNIEGVKRRPSSLGNSL